MNNGKQYRCIICNEMKKGTEEHIIPKSYDEYKNILNGFNYKFIKGNAYCNETWWRMAYVTEGE